MHVKRAAEELWRHEKPPRCILWVDKVDRTGRMRLTSTNLELGIQSRIEGMKEAANKSCLERCLELCRELGLAAFDVHDHSAFVRTWLLPEQKGEFEAHVRTQRLSSLARGRCVPTYIAKPSGGSEGIGIFLLQHEREVPRYKVATIPLVAQEYIPPMLLDGKKFDLRLYVLIRSVDPLEVYVHREGLARFCTEDYEAPSEANLGRSYAHVNGRGPTQTSPATPNRPAAPASPALTIRLRLTDDPSPSH